MDKKTAEKLQKNWGKILAKAWTDEAFKQRLLKNPTQILKENGVEVPPDFTFKLHENSDKVFHLTIPKKPEKSLSAEELKSIAAATGVYGCEID